MPNLILNPDDITIIASLLSIGFFGGFSHCVTMCGPFVITQVSQKLSSCKIEDYYGIKKLSKIALLPYHLGRITTYGFIGFFCAFLRTNLDHQIGFDLFSATLILLALFYFIHLFVKNNYLKFSNIKNFFSKIKFPKIKFISTSNFFGIILKKFSNKISFLLNNSSGFNGYILGIVLGFLPCGMLYGAFALAGNLSNYFLAFLGMIIFGVATFFALFTVGFFAKLSFKLPEFKIIANIVIIINILMLFKMFLKKFS